MEKQGWQRWVPAELPFGEEVKELLGQPVEDSEHHQVGLASGFPIMDCQAQIKVRPQLLHTLSILHREGSGLSHHQVHHDAVGG